MCDGSEKVNFSLSFFRESQMGLRDTSFVGRLLGAGLAEVFFFFLKGYDGLWATFWGCLFYTSPIPRAKAKLVCGLLLEKKKETIKGK